MNEKPDETLKEIPKLEDFPVVGKSELERLGFNTSDELVISPGQIKRPSPPIKM